MRGKAIFATAVVLAFLALAAQPASGGHGAIPTERTWGDHREWEMLAPVFYPKAAEPSHAPLYVIGAIDEFDPQSPGHDSDIGAHDHVVSVPPRNKGAYSAMWHVFAVLPGPSAIPGVNVNFRIVPSIFGDLPLVYEADLGSGLHSLKTDGEAETAAALGLVVFVDTGIVFVCPIRPMKA